MMNKSVLTKYQTSTKNADFFWNSLFFAVGSGILLFLSFPKYGSGFIAWIALIPLFWALKETKTVRRALLLGFITGLIGHVGILYWITYVIVNYGYLPIYLGIILMLLLAAYLSLYTAIFAACIVFFRRKIAVYIIAPVLWVCLEYCKSYFLTGFPWENLGYSQYLHINLIQFADISGVYGLSFMIVLANATLLEVIIKRSRRAFVLLSIVALIIVAILIYGINRTKIVDKYLQNASPIEVLLVQGNIDQSIKWHESYQKETINIYEQLSMQNAPAKNGLIIWPETAVPFNYQDENDFQKKVRDIAVKTKNWFIFGSTSYVGQKRDRDYYNSAYLLAPDGEIKGKYDKVHLVPYGEYVPLRDVFPFIRKLTAGMGDFSVGTGYYPLSLDERKVGVLICYEGILPFASRMYKNGGAGLLISITNDAWFGATSAPFQHFSMAVFRAVETKMFLVRAANTGVSGIVNPKGEIVLQTRIFEKAAVKGNVKFAYIKTIYAQYGDILVFLCFGFVLMSILWIWTGRIRNAGRKYSGKS
jgi:apolipoprotein N-acyltransferase